MDVFCLVMGDAPYVALTTKHEIDHNLSGVYQEDVQPWTFTHNGWTVYSGEVS